MITPLQTRIGLGLAALGRPGYINIGHADDLGRRYDPARMEARAHEVLDAAWAAGVRYFDAARSYGRAEEFLARWIARRAVRRDDLLVGSKWGYVYTAGWKTDADAHEVKEHSLDNLRRQWRESQALLGSHLHLYQIHSATRDSGVLDNRTVLDELRRIGETGITIGLSVSGPQQGSVVRQALTVKARGAPLFGAVQATWNVLEPSCGPALAEAHARGLFVIVKEPLANGRLTSRTSEPPSAVLAREAARRGTTIDALAIAAAMAQPWAGVVLSGAARVEHLLSNLRARDIAWDDEAAGSVARLAETPSEYWARRSALPWN